MVAPPGAGGEALCIGTSTDDQPWESLDASGGAQRFVSYQQPQYSRMVAAAEVLLGGILSLAKTL
ncbi:hypothetical protein GGD55_002418 [Rhizobium giardinii]|jgi:hypothetical protein|uniref:Uncharacterized protein n=1 Tax=Rhizobium giardinii TaxID=56731 RepID=A0A7W8X821_9HYPH|nr:hypothetical protein [Rhizobium giardinii]